MRFSAKQILVIFQILMIVLSENVNNSTLNLNDVIKNGLNEVHRKTNFMIQSLQENIVHDINENRENLFLFKENIKENIKKIIEENSTECKSLLRDDIENILQSTAKSFQKCSFEISESSQEYRQKVIDDISEIEAEINLRDTIDECFRIDSIKCNTDEIIRDNNRLAIELKVTFHKIIYESDEYAIQVLSDFMECNKEVMKKAKDHEVILQKKILDCMKTENNRNEVNETSIILAVVIVLVCAVLYKCSSLYF